MTDIGYTLVRLDLNRSGWDREGRSPSRLDLEGLAPTGMTQSGRIVRVKLTEQVRSEVNSEDLRIDKTGAEFLADERLANEPLAFPPAVAALGVEA